MRFRADGGVVVKRDFSLGYASDCWPNAADLSGMAFVKQLMALVTPAPSACFQRAQRILLKPSSGHVGGNCASGKHVTEPRLINIDNAWSGCLMAMNISRRSMDGPKRMDTHDVVIVGAGISGSAASDIAGAPGAENSCPREKIVLLTSTRPIVRPLFRQVPFLLFADSEFRRSLRRRGAVRNSALFWTEFGWIVDRLQRDKAYGHGYSVQAEKNWTRYCGEGLYEVGNVTIRLGATLDSLVESEDGNIVGIGYLGADGIRRESHAQLVILADGRNSRGADLASVPTVRRGKQPLRLFCLL